MATYIQLPWIERSGLIEVFGAQAGITGASVVIIIFLQMLGGRLRHAQGQMKFATN